MKVILASKSPRRKELLSLILPQFAVCESGADEMVNGNASPLEKISEISKRKADAIKGEKGDIIISADTAVVFENRILGKPENSENAAEMLKMLSGKTHKVITAFTVKKDEKSVTEAVETEVSFNPLSDAEIENYIKTGEPFDKAGAYGIQGYAAKFISKISGDYFTVVGLPVSALYKTLKEFGLFEKEH